MRRWWVGLLMLAGTAAPGIARAQDPAIALPGPGPFDGPLQVSITPYVWGVNLSGHTTVRGVKADVDVSFSDILKDLNGAVMLDAVIRKGRFAIFLDTVFSQLEDGAASVGGAVGVDVTINQLIQDAALAFRVGAWELADVGSIGSLSLAVDPYVGIRYTYLDVEAQGRIDFERSFGRRRDRIVTIDRQATASQSKQWIDPIVGARTTWTLGNRVAATIAGDVGGFGVGSDFTWQALGVVGYRFGLLAEDNAVLFVGYKALYQDYREGSGRNEFEWNVTMHGPMTGLAIRF